MRTAARYCAALAAILPLFAADIGRAQTITVSPVGPIRTLTAAIQSAPRHGRIVVMPGVYAERTIVVSKPVEIIGEGWPVLDGKGRDRS